MSKSITGTIEAVNQKGTGIKLSDGNWYNLSKFFKGDIPPKGTAVRLTTDDEARWINDLEIVAATNGNGAPPASPRADWETKDRRITRMAAVNSAIAYATLKVGDDADARGKLRLEHVLRYAAEIEAWVLREEQAED